MKLGGLSSSTTKEVEKPLLHPIFPQVPDNEPQEAKGPLDIVIEADQAT